MEVIALLFAYERFCPGRGGVFFYGFNVMYHNLRFCEWLNIHF